MNFERFALIAIDTNNLPFVMFNLDTLTVNMQKAELTNVIIAAKDITATYYEKDQESLVERRMLGDLEKMEIYNLDNFNQQQLINSILNSFSQYVKDLQDIPDSRRLRVKIDITLSPNGAKDIKIDFDGVKFYLITKVYLKFAEFSSVEASPIPMK
jgi:aminopeptidase N